MKKAAKYSTPMMQQWAAIKKEYTDSLLFFRLGDFYELFEEDAEIGAEVLDITLTSRPRGKDGKIPMAGMPYHAVDNYLSKLVKAGYKVAICEQVSQPQQGGIVEREVVRIVTPGTILDEKSLNKKQNNFLISLCTDKTFLGIAACDISTGHFEVKQIEVDELPLQLIEEISRINPAECILPLEHYEDTEILRSLKHKKNINIFEFKNWDSYAKSSEEFLKDHFNVKTLNHFNIHNKSLACKAAASLLGYLKETQKSELKHIKKIISSDTNDFVSLDRATITNLEIFSTLRDRETHGSLLSLVDNTKTAMGGRLLKHWIISPLKEKRGINNRLNIVEELIKNNNKHLEMLEILKNINDIERILAKVSSGLANPRDLISLKESLRHALSIKHKLVNFNSELALNIQENISSNLKNLITLINNSILDEPSIHIKDGNIIKTGFDKKLDKLKSSISIDHDWILNLEAKEKKRTNISTLKVGFNKVFGYYIEISKSNASSAPADYIRKQTLVNGERFITPELKKREEKILKADEKIKQLEYEIFNKIIKEILRYTEDIQTTANQIAITDVLTNFASLATENNYVKPKILYSNEIRIKKSRHPVVERILSSGQFVPNDITIKPSKQNLLLITGPNMAGKSVLMRQVALIVLMAQIGSFVPASSAHIGITDKIFVRSGASDVISSGLSTFMLEMVEAAYILNNATRKSLIIMDEIGRGTSTYDGISIAWAVAEYLIKNGSPKTLFATHYHELQKLEEKHPKKIVNYSMQIEDPSAGSGQANSEPIFLYNFVKGAADHSFGIAVAKMAGVPMPVIKNAKKILKKLENPSASSEQAKINKNIKNLISKIDINNTTPLEALRMLEKLKKLNEF